MSIYEYDEERQRIWDREEGLEAGIEEGLKASIKIVRELGLSKEEATRRLTDASDLDEERILSLIEKYWE